MSEEVRSALWAKWRGAGQLISMVTASYARPIPTPIHHLRPADKTCENCHEAQRPFGDKLRIFRQFADDESNTSSYTVLLMRLGGGSRGGGIHGAHLGNGVAIEYLSDPERETISWVGFSDASGRLTEYAEGWNPEQAEGFMRRSMDCTDCHNRPAHTFQDPARAVDEALYLKTVDRELPFIKRDALKVLRGPYQTREQAGPRIKEAVTDFYAREYPEVAAARGE